MVHVPRQRAATRRVDHEFLVESEEVEVAEALPRVGFLAKVGDVLADHLAVVLHQHFVGLDGLRRKHSIAMDSRPPEFQHRLALVEERNARKVVGCGQFFECALQAAVVFPALPNVLVRSRLVLPDLLNRDIIALLHGVDFLEGLAARAPRWILLKLNLLLRQAAVRVLALRNKFVDVLEQRRRGLPAHLFWQLGVVRHARPLPPFRLRRPLLRRLVCRHFEQLRKELTVFRRVRFGKRGFRGGGLVGGGDRGDGAAAGAPLFWTGAPGGDIRLVFFVGGFEENIFFAGRGIGIACVVVTGFTDEARLLL
mmetsp:Transcript_12836/g.32530  ORF Transcript_12836/g.32530 Transcript_12836/m.32530 type:complete len:310 (+) Transcript_12836:271-1200(+)